MTDVDHWPVLLRLAAAEWAAALPPTEAPDNVAEWPSSLAAMRGRMATLKRSGQWARGPVDLLTICRLHRWELAHNAALAWLCDPEAGHGLGTAFLERLLGRTSEVADLDQDIAVGVEVSRELSRADVIVSAALWTLVIEVKVDADEGVEQCERLFRDWGEDGNTRFLFLTKTGRPPRSVVSIEASHAWTAVAWRDVLADLQAVEHLVPPEAAGAGAVAEYRRTLQSLYGRSH